MFEDVLKTEPGWADVQKLMIQMWVFSGDFISKIYAGTNAVLQQLSSQQKTTLLDRINQGVTSVRRFIKQNLSDDFKQEVMMILSGQHLLCNSVAPSVVIQEFERFYAQGGNEKTNMIIVTLNCGAKQPDSYKELKPIFERKLEGFEPDIIVVGL